MIRPLTCVCMLMAAGSGLYLYQTKHRAQMLDREIARTYKQIDQTKDRIGVLKGEWALLNEPERLNELAQQHLALKTLAPNQFVALADLSSRLPAPLPPGAVTPPADDPASELALTLNAAAKTLTPRPLATIDKPAAEKPTQLATLSQPAQPQPAQPQPSLPQHPPQRMTAPAAPSGTIAAAQPSHPLPAPPVQASIPGSRIMAPVMSVSAGAIQSGIPHASVPGSIGESVARAHRSQASNTMVLSARQPSAAPTSPAPTYQQPAYAPPASAQPSYGSALGSVSRIALPAPVPFGTVQAER